MGLGFRGLRSLGVRGFESFLGFRLSLRFRASGFLGLRVRV